MAHLFQYAPSFFGEGVLQLPQYFAHPAAHMELADLVIKAHFLGHDPVTEQIIRDDHCDPMLLHQRLQPTRAACGSYSFT